MNEYCTIWGIQISRPIGVINNVELTFVGDELFNRLRKFGAT